MRVDVQNASFSYKKGAAEPYLLQDIRFTLEQGEILTVLGSNGAGKTTLIKCVLGLLPWTKGETLLDGRPIREWAHRELWQKIAYVPQARLAAFSYLVEDMVLLGRNAHLRLFEQPNDKDRAIAEQAMKEIGIERLRGRACNELSGGELQMVLIARALCGEPDLLVLDEPESNLDFRNQLIVLETVERLCKERHLSAIINTHYPEHALQLSDKTVLVGNKGRHFFGRTEEMLSEALLREIFQVDVCVQRWNCRGREKTCVIPLTALDE
ncbi:MAG: ABC transporter ATP-binding protein [Ndongobacter sp.]|nr:ABC transporter ATP-binding protein [Ndongobacter sp.]